MSETFCKPDGTHTLCLIQAEGSFFNCISNNPATPYVAKREKYTSRHHNLHIHFLHFNMCSIMLLRQRYCNSGVWKTHTCKFMCAFQRRSSIGWLQCTPIFIDMIMLVSLIKLLFCIQCRLSVRRVATAVFQKLAGLINCVVVCPAPANQRICEYAL